VYNDSKASDLAYFKIGHIEKVGHHEDIGSCFGVIDIGSGGDWWTMVGVRCATDVKIRSTLFNG
jgi:hypothetical protein